MKQRALVVGLLTVLASLAIAAPSALGDDDPGETDLVSPLDVSDRYRYRPPGVEHEMSFYYGPFVIPPGQDRNQITLDVPVHDGFLTSVQATVYDAVTGQTPSNQDMHIHHAHWFRTSDDPDDEYYALNLAWVFGTGEERTKGDINLRSEAEGEDGPSYGIFIEQGQPQALIYMLHNKNPVVREVYVALDVKFVYGTAGEIQAADGCDDLFMEANDTCRAGEDFHHLYGKLWGTTFDVPRDFPTLEDEQDDDGTYVHPRDIPEDAPERRSTDDLGRFWEVGYDATAIGSAGHLHQNGERVVIANLGPEGSGCEADLDEDGFPGVTLFYSDRIPDEPDAYPHSAEFQMGVTKPGWRAPVREGDRITQFGIYDNAEYASYEAMAYTGFYMDREQVPEPRPEDICRNAPQAALAAMGPTLIDNPDGDPLETIRNHEVGDGHQHSHGHCGIEGEEPCNEPVDDLQEGEVTDTIHIADFAYVPGDQSLSGDLGSVPKVVQGEPLTVINHDVGIGVRHTLTTCGFPCNGEYVANYPQPDGRLDTGRLGNLDYLDGGLVQDNGGPAAGYGPSEEASPVTELDTTDLEPGMYSYYCRLHPWMRGMFEVVSAS